MTRLVTRGELVEMLRDEIRSSSNTSRSTDHLRYLQRLIQRHNKTLTDDYDWPYMDLAKTDARKTLAAGQRYYDFPTKLNTERIDSVWYQETNDTQWRELVYGIGPEQYSEHDSDDDDRSDVITHWDFVNDANDNLQFEVWPIPASDNGTIWFVGQRKPNALTDDAHKADHDDELIVLRAAAEALLSKNKKDADIKSTLAGDRLTVLKSRLGSKKKASVGGGGYIKPTQKRRVLVARSESGESS